jgi:hypothetical protein
MFGNKPQESDLMKRSKAFAEQALKSKTTTKVLFLELPVYLTVLFQAKGQPVPENPEAVRHVMQVEEKLDFKCVECGKLGSDLVLRAYDPRRVTKESALCPNCRGGDKVEITYDPARKTTL